MKIKARLFPLLVTVAAVVALLGITLSCSSKKSSDEQVETTPVARDTVRTVVQATATATPEHKLEIIPTSSGRAETVEVDMGQKVKQGQILLWMSSTERASMLDAALAKGQKELEFWKDVYKATPIVAPLDGMIISRNVVPGQTLTTTTNVFVMSDRLIIEADLDETDLGKVKLDQPVDVTLDGLPDLRLHGKVYKIAYASTTVSNVTTYKVDVLLDQTPDDMRSGMTANVTFITAEHKDVLTVPATALHEGNQVFVLDAKTQKVAARDVKIGLNNGKTAEVLSGLTEGELVVNNSYKAVEAASNTGFSLMPKMPKRKGNSSPPPQ
jgi:membrane fusion protein, macrolide-specific efflux system